MTERPILFSGPMVRALLDGSKTQTRRVVTLPCKRISLKYGAVDIKEVKYYAPPSGKSQEGWADPGVNYWTYDKTDGHMIGNHVDPCPYGEVGDQLWVRETWHSSNNLDLCSPKQIANAAMEAGYKVTPKNPAGDLWYAADDIYRQWGDRPFIKGKKRVSIHMPRKASRIQLEITDIRVERLKDISANDVRREGKPNGAYSQDNWCIDWYRELWESINGAGSWNANPWVWVLEFKVIKP